MPSIQIDDRIIDYQINRKPDIYFTKIYIDEINGIQVTVNDQKSDGQVEAFVEKKADWIFEKWQEHHPELYRFPTFESEQKISYLGRSYKLYIEESEEDSAAFSFQKGKFFFNYPPALSDSEQELAEELSAWLKDKAKTKFKEVSSKNVAVEEDRTRLGYKQNGEIHLNWRLVQCSKEEIKQVIGQLERGETC
ncbi:DUF45 domain-containing protein [Halobacillus fulvus]|nr:DUF45 domain-containing protein [Halobacillus fulvus]